MGRRWPNYEGCCAQSLHRDGNFYSAIPSLLFVPKFPWWVLTEIICTRLHSSWSVTQQVWHPNMILIISDLRYLYKKGRHSACNCVFYDFIICVIYLSGLLFTKGMKVSSHFFRQGQVSSVKPFNLVNWCPSVLGKVKNVHLTFAVDNPHTDGRMSERI